MNQKMTAVANEIGNSICKYYDEDYLELLFEDNQIAIEDVIFQILVECCRYIHPRCNHKQWQYHLKQYPFHASLPHTYHAALPVDKNDLS